MFSTRTPLLIPFLMCASVCFGQHFGPAMHATGCERLHKETMQDYIDRFGPFVVKDHIYHVEYTNSTMFGHKPGLFIYEYDLAAGRCLRTADLHIDPKQDKVSWVGVLNDALVVVRYYIDFDEKHYLIHLFAQRFSLDDFTPMGDAVPLSRGELRNYQEATVPVTVIKSSDKDALLVAVSANNTDDKNAQDNVMAVVLDEDLVPVWKAFPAVGRITPQGSSAYASVTLDEDDNAYFTGYVWSGTNMIDAGTRITTQLVRVHGNDLATWDMHVEGGQLDNALLEVVDGELHVSGAILNPKATKRYQEWCIVKMDGAMSPQVVVRGNLPGEGTDEVDWIDLCAKPEDGSFVIGRYEGTLFVSSIDASGTQLWNKTLSKAPGNFAGFYVRGGELHLPCMGNAGEAAEINKGNGGKSSRAYKQLPMLLIFDATGTLSAEEIIPAKDGGIRDVSAYRTPRLSCLKEYGMYLDLDHGKDRSGIVAVPLR